MTAPRRARTAAAVAFGLLAALALAGAARAQDSGPLSLKYQLNATEVQQGETFQLDVILTVRTQQQVEEVALPDIPRGLTVVQERRSSSTQIGVTNGRQSISIEQRYMFLLRGDEAGTFKIPEATAKLGKYVARAAPVLIKVDAGGNGNGSNNDDNAAAAVAGSSTAGARFGKNPPQAFLEVTLDRDSAVVGQQVTATTEVYSHDPLGQWPRLPPLKPPGFFCTPLLGDERPNPTQRSVAGKLYYVYLVNKDALFPVKEGDAVVPAQQVDLQPAGSFFSRPREISVKSAPVKLKVKPLPTEDRPSHFAPGNVGVWQLTTAVRPQTAALDQPFTLSIIATGTGGLEQLQMPSWDPSEAEPAGARVFPATSKIERRDTSNEEPELGGRVAVEMLVQPLREGELHIPSFSLSYYDPFAGAYKTSTTRPVTVAVRPAKNGAASSSNAGGGGPRQTIAKGARPLKMHVVAEPGAGEVPVVAGAVIALAGLASLVVTARTRKKSASLDGKRAAAARERQRLLDDGKVRGDLAVLERVLLDVVAERAGPEAKSRATADLAAFLVERGLERALADDVVKFIRDVEAARYAPGASAERARLGETCGALVARLEAP